MKDNIISNGEELKAARKRLQKAQRDSRPRGLYAVENGVVVFYPTPPHSIMRTLGHPDR